MSANPLRNSPLARRLGWMSLFVSGSALLLASLAFLIYDQITFRESMVRNLSAQAQIVGANSISALTFNDPQSAEVTLSALNSFPEILSAGIYAADGHVFARYMKNPVGNAIAVATNRANIDEKVESRSDEIFLVRPIMFQGKKVGAVYIRSSVTALSHRFWRYILIASIVLLVSLIVALLISAVYRQAIVGPIVNLAQTAQSVTEQKNYSLRATSVAQVLSGTPARQYLVPVPFFHALLEFG